MDYPNIFSSFNINKLTIKNRIVMTPMGTNFAGSNGEIMAKHVKYYEKRAKGGTGIIIVENACVDFPAGSNGTTQIRIDHDKFIPGFYNLTDTIHKYGTCIALQINHAGASAIPGRIGSIPVSASDIPSKTGGAVPRELAKNEIEKIAEKYGMAAKRAKMAGFDMVEIHGGHSYLLSQFLSPVYNKRRDEFGGSIENRTRFPKMVIDNVRNKVGENFPVILRISAEEFVAGGNTLEDTLKILEYLKHGVDIFDVSAGLNDSIFYQIDQMNLPDGWRSYMAWEIKRKFKKPVITTGNIREPKVAEDILDSGKADFIGMGRGLIADPYWVHKVENKNEKSIRKCISCNIGCANNRIGLNRPIKCTVNPDVINNEDYKLNKIKRPVNVVVIGGGTAGLEAACTAAEVGCTTFILEKNSYIGGLARRISKLPDKKRIGDFPDYLIDRTKHLKDLFIFKNESADIEKIEKLKPDIIVNATGSKPILPSIKGLLENVDKKDGNVYSTFGFLDNIHRFNNCKNKKAVVIGGGAVGLDVVEFFAKKNVDLKIVEMMPVLGRDLDVVSKPSIMSLIKKYGVEVYTNTTLEEVFPDHFKVKSNDGEMDMNFDFGFVCLGMKSEKKQFESIEDYFKPRNVEVINIGDSMLARKIISGTEEGRNILYTLKKINAL